MQIFLDANCAVSTPTCGPCLGGYMGVLAPGERSISTTNRNFVGRMGDPTSEVYLSSPAVAAASAVLYCVLNRDVNLIQQWRQINWASIVLGLVLVGLEAGFIYAYKAGWQVSTAATVQSAFLAILLLAVGVALYHEAITWNKIVGVAVCLIGLAILNK